MIEINRLSNKPPTYAVTLDTDTHRYQGEITDLQLKELTEDVVRLLPESFTVKHWNCGTDCKVGEPRQTIPDKTNRLLKLKPGWLLNSTGEPITDSTANFVTETLQCATDYEVPSPEIYPNPTGWLRCKWRLRHCEVIWEYLHPGGHYLVTRQLDTNRVYEHIIHDEDKDSPTMVASAICGLITKTVDND